MTNITNTNFIMVYKKCFVKIHYKLIIKKSFHFFVSLLPSKLSINLTSDWYYYICSMLSTGFSSLKTWTTRQPTWNPYIMFILFMTVLTIWKKILNKFTIFVTSCRERMNRMGSFESLFFFLRNRFENQKMISVGQHAVYKPND